MSNATQVHAFTLAGSLVLLLSGAERTQLVNWSTRTMGFGHSQWQYIDQGRVKVCSLPKRGSPSPVAIPVASSDPRPNTVHPIASLLHPLGGRPIGTSLERI